MNQNEEMQRLRQENEKLRQDNQALVRKGEQYATFGDLMKTIVMLPLAADVKTTAMEERVKTALLIHGISPDSPAGYLVRAGIIEMLTPDREKLVRFGKAAAARRADNGDPQITPGCTCPVCTTVAAAQQIIATETRRGRRAGPNDPRSDAKIGENDYFMTKELEQRATPVDRQIAEKTAQDLLGLVQDMGLAGAPMPGAGGILDLLEALLGGGMPMPGRGRGGRGRPGEPIMEMFLLGPNGLQRLDEG